VTQTQGPTGSPTPPGSALNPGQFGTPTRGGGSGISWTIEHDELAYLRVDGLLSRPVFRAPLPKGWTLVTAVAVYRDGGLYTSGNSVDYPEGITFDYDPDFAWRVDVSAQILMADESPAPWPVDVYYVARVSGSYREDIQLPDRDCVIVCNDNLYHTDGDVILIASGSADSAPNIWGLGEWIGGDRLFLGHMGFKQPFTAPFTTPAERADAIVYAHDIARRQNHSANLFFNADYTTGGSWIDYPVRNPTSTRDPTRGP
jgi:hypothetical protein